MPPSAKRRRKNAETGNNSAAAASTSSEGQSRANWGALPRIALEQIFSYLDHKDRFRASLVCRNWSETYDCPSLWRDVKFRFRSPSLAPYGQWVNSIVKRYGNFFRSLSFTFKRCSFNSIYLQIKVCSLMRHLGEHTQLDALKMKKVSTFRGHTAACPIFKSVKEFVENQTRLRVVCFSQAHVSVSMGLELLGTLNRSNVEVLRLINFFCPRLRMTINEINAFTRLLPSFSNLRKLALDYRTLYGLTGAIGSSMGARLQVLTVNLTLAGRMHSVPVLREKDWQDLTKACPAMSVHFILSLYGEVDARPYLPAVMPLKSFDFVVPFIYRKIYCGPVYKHLEDNFDHSLENFKLYVRTYTSDTIGAALVDLGSKCFNLKKIVTRTVYSIFDYSVFLKAITDRRFPSLEYVKMRFKHHWSIRGRYKYLKKRRRFYKLMEGERLKTVI